MPLFRYTSSPFPLPLAGDINRGIAHGVLQKIVFSLTEDVDFAGELHCRLSRGRPYGQSSPSGGVPLAFRRRLVLVGLPGVSKPE